MSVHDIYSSAFYFAPLNSFILCPLHLLNNILAEEKSHSAYSQGVQGQTVAAGSDALLQLVFPFFCAVSGWMPVVGEVCARSLVGTPTQGGHAG